MGRGSLNGWTMKQVMSAREERVTYPKRTRISTGGQYVGISRDSNNKTLGRIHVWPEQGMTARCKRVGDKYKQTIVSCWLILPIPMLETTNQYSTSFDHHNSFCQSIASKKSGILSGQDIAFYYHQKTHMTPQAADPIYTGTFNSATLISNASEASLTAHMSSLHIMPTSSRNSTHQGPVGSLWRYPSYI